MPKLARGASVTPLAAVGKTITLKTKLSDTAAGRVGRERLRPTGQLEKSHSRGEASDGLQDCGVRRPMRLKASGASAPDTGAPANFDRRHGVVSRAQTGTAGARSSATPPRSEPMAPPAEAPG